jgi:hypothetical protein
VCRCSHSAGKAAPPELQETGVLFGETGLVKLRCTSDCVKTYGDYTGWVYRFDINPTVFVDKRDVPFLLRPGLDYG